MVNCWVCSALWMTKVSSMYLSQILDGVGGSANVYSFKVLHKQVGYQMAYGGAHGCTLYLLLILTFKGEKILIRQNLRRVMMLLMNREVLLLSCGSCCNLPWMMSIAGSTRNNINSAFTSLEDIHSPCWSWMDLICSTRCCLFLMWCAEASCQWSEKGG